MHQYQVRSYKAWCHHIALTMMAMLMLQTRIEMQDDLPLLSCPDVKLVLARTLLNELPHPAGRMEGHRKQAQAAGFEQEKASQLI